MQGYVRVSPAGANVPLMANTSPKAKAQIAKLGNTAGKSGGR
jgi:hypothetical protein